MLGYRDCGAGNLTGSSSGPRWGLQVHQKTQKDGHWLGGSVLCSGRRGLQVLCSQMKPRSQLWQNIQIPAEFQLGREERAGPVCLGRRLGRARQSVRTQLRSKAEAWLTGQDSPFPTSQVSVSAAGTLKSLLSLTPLPGLCV